MMNTDISSYQSPPKRYNAITILNREIDANNISSSKQSRWERTVRNVAFVVPIFCLGMLAGNWTGYGHWSETQIQQVSVTTSSPDDVTSLDSHEAVMAKLKAESLVENLEHGAVASDDGRCSEIGNNILENLGGNAIDAAVAVTLCLGIVNPSGSTPAGGAVCLI
jgi:hypothetical protein